MKIRKNKLFIVLLFIFAIFMTGCLNTEKFTIGTDYIEKTMYVGDKTKFSTNKSTFLRLVFLSLVKTSTRFVSSSSMIPTFSDFYS